MLASRFRPVLCGQVVDPLVYDENLTIAQQIACLYTYFHSMDSNFVTVQTFEDFLAALDAEQEAQTETLEQYTDDEIAKLYTALMAEINKLVGGQMIWDVTQGARENDIETMRNLFNDVTVHGLTVDQLTDATYNEAALTVDSLADCGLNVRGLAVWGGQYLIPDAMPEGILYTEGD